MKTARQKYYVVDYGDKLYVSIHAKLKDAEKEAQELEESGYKVHIKTAYKAT